MNTSFHLFSNLLVITVFPLFSCIAGNLAYKFRKCTAIVVSHRGRGYFLENILEDSLMVWDQEFSNRLSTLYFCKMDEYGARGGRQNRYESDGNVPLD